MCAGREQAQAPNPVALSVVMNPIVPVLTNERGCWDLELTVIYIGQVCKVVWLRVPGTKGGKIISIGNLKPGDSPVYTPPPLPS